MTDAIFRSMDRAKRFLRLFDGSPYEARLTLDVAEGIQIYRVGLERRTDDDA